MRVCMRPIFYRHSRPLFPSLHITAPRFFLLRQIPKIHFRVLLSQFFVVVVVVVVDFVVNLESDRRYGSEDREGGDGVEGTGDHHVVRQQLRIHR